MTADWNILGPGSLIFFGKITATITHELNNTIGIINENAGLLEDLGLIAQQGKTPDIKKWVQISKKIGCQVQRAHETIRNLNSFAHCADHAKVMVNPDSLLKLAIDLSSRHLAQKDVIAELMEAKESIDIYIHPFLFLNLLSECILFAADHADQNKKIVIHNIHDNKRFCICFSGVMDGNESAFSDIVKQELLNVLDAKIKYQADKNKFSIFMDTHKLVNKNNN